MHRTLPFIVLVALAAGCPSKQKDPTFTVGGQVTGLRGTGLELTLGGGQSVTVDADGPFVFATQLADGARYTVTVLAQPGDPDQVCTVADGSGFVEGADVTDVAVTCQDLFTIGGTVTGLAGTGLVLQQGGGDDLSLAADGAFTFATPVVDGGAYAVTVLTQPLGQHCTVAQGTGTVSGAAVTDVSVTCGCGPDGPGPDEDLGTGPDPAGGVFGLDEALDGLPDGDGPLRAIITTEHGTVTCTLEASEVPNGVANFVGLARGRRPWRDPATGSWVRRRFYDGLIFHRIIADFMIQGGDPLGTGYGGPGYQFDDEITSLVHVPGTLAYANSGANTNGSQFYITEIATDWLDGGYTIFGYCEPLDVISTLAALPTGVNDRPVTDVHMQSIEITRCPLP
jgi:peptidyl-prolyl cis-trans isomerase A (cyclophilin A)